MYAIRSYYARVRAASHNLYESRRYHGKFLSDRPRLLAGIGFLPKANVAQNLILGYHRNKPYSDGHFINWKTVFKETRSQIKEYNIKTSGPDDVGGNLSGGNIQRVLIARASYNFV